MPNRIARAFKLEDVEELENLKMYSRNESIQQLVMKEWNRRYPAD